MTIPSGSSTFRRAGQARVLIVADDYDVIVCDMSVLYKPVGAAALGKLIAEVYAVHGPRP